MKADNLRILQDMGFLVPRFIMVTEESEIDLSFSTAKKFAVRSSFTAEDGDESSYAGQFDTILNVKREDVVSAFRKVKESADETLIGTYQTAVGSKEAKEGHMVVIIQEMVDAEVSGVLFSANPLGILNEIVIVAGFGLGNNVVEDKIETTTYYYNADDQMYLRDGTEETPKLTEHQIKELVKMSGQIRKHFSQEMDVEYAILDGKIYLLQVRPITTLSKEALDCIILDNSNIVESYPGITLPLTQSFVHEIYYKVFETLVLRLTRNKQLVDRMQPSLQHMTDMANGRIYYRISNWYTVLELLPFSKKVIAIWQEMLGVSQKTVVSTKHKVKLSTKLRLLHGFFSYLRKTPKLMEELNTYFRKELPNYWKSVEASNEIQELLGIYESIKKELTSKWDITLINDMYAFIYTALAGKKHKNALSCIKNLESMKPVKAMEELVALAKKDGMDSEVFATAKSAYIAEYGDRILEELKLETKTYRTDPKLVDAYVLAQVKADKKNGSSLNNTKEKELTNKVKNTLFVRRAKLGIYNREVSRLNRSRIFGIARAILLKVGVLLYEQGFLETPYDVFYLYYEEIKAGAFDDFKKLVSDRKQEYEIYETIPAFSRLIFEKKVVSKHLKNSTSYVCAQDVLHGIGVSGGKVTGQVIVIDKPSQDIDTTGKILVTKMTDPGWVFLIKNCAGIIAEKGSLLSHTAIVTRELGKPAVVNVKDATRILQNGDMVELDADTGLIRMLE